MRDYEELSRIHFNSQAHIYDEGCDNMFISKEGVISCRDVAERIGSGQPISLLDIGCGTGNLISLVSERREGRFFGIDIAENMVAAARKKNIKNACFSAGSAQNLPFDDGSFDIVTCTQSFHHYSQPEKALSEVLRVLKNGGVYYLSDTGVSGIGAFIDNYLLFPFMKSGDFKCRGRKEVEKMVTKAGFTAVQGFKIARFIYTISAEKPV